MRSNHEDVLAFTRKFSLPEAPAPTNPGREFLDFRRKFLQEELDEFKRAVEDGNLTEMFDALLDLAYVAHGTAIACGFPWQEGWDEVHRTNMAKVPGVTKRGFGVDMTKPEGWRPPDLRRILLRASLRSAPPREETAS